MDDLCNLMKRSHLVCTDENNDNLIAAYKESSDLICTDAIHGGISEYHMKTYLQRHHDRYTEYLHKVRFKGHFLYLEELIQDFIEKCQFTKDVGLARDEFRYLMLLSHFIDSSILTSIGVLSIDKD